MSDLDESKEKKECASVLHVLDKRWGIPKYSDDPRYKVIPNAKTLDEAQKEKAKKQKIKQIINQAVAENEHDAEELTK